MVHAPATATATATATARVLALSVRICTPICMQHVCMRVCGRVCTRCFRGICVCLGGEYGDKRARVRIGRPAFIAPSCARAQAHAQAHAQALAQARQCERISFTRTGADGASTDFLLILACADIRRHAQTCADMHTCARVHLCIRSFVRRSMCRFVRMRMCAPISARVHMD